MALIEIPEMLVLSGEDAIELLSQKIKEFQQQKGTRLTEKQVDTLTKTANEMISMIRREKRSKKPVGKPRNSGLFSLFRKLGVS